MANRPTTTEPSARSELWLSLIGATLYVAVACWISHPLLSHMWTWVPIGTEEVRTVPMFNAWTLWWNADRASHGFSGYWDAPIFFPAKNSFAFSEPQPLSLLAAPVYAITGSLVVAYNFYYLLSLTLNGLFTQWLLRTRSLHPGISIGAGIAMVLLPAVQWQSGVVQLVPLWGILWTWLVIARMLSRPDLHADMTHAWFSRESWRDGIELGFALSAVCYAAVHHALFLSVLLLCSSIALGSRLRSRSLWFSLFSAACISLILVAPILVHLHRMTEDIDFDRPREVVSRLSLQLSDYAVSFGNGSSELFSSADSPWPICPGLLKLCLALCSAILLVKRSVDRRWIAFLWISGAAALLLSLGTNAEWGAIRPWQWLTDIWPGFAQVRSAFRFAYFVQMIVVLLAAESTAAVLRRLWTRCSSALQSASHTNSQSRWLIRIATVATTVFASVAIIDPLPPAQRFGVFPDFKANQDWLDALRNAEQDAELRGAVFCLPTHSGESVRDFEPITEWMLLGSVHGAPLVNGYSGFFPPESLKLAEEAAAGPLTGERWRQLYDAGVRYAAVDRRRYAVTWSADEPFGSLTFRKLISSPSGIDVYQILDASIEPTR